MMLMLLICSAALAGCLEGDEEETQGSGCAIGGVWVDKTTDHYFKNKRVH